MSHRRSLKPGLAVEAWLKRGLVDFFIAFKLHYLIKYRLFCLQQGIEKFCKAYLIASESQNYENLDSDKAGQWIDDFVKPLGHDTRLLLERVSIGIDSLGVYLEDNDFIDLLNKGEEEGRYPIPIAKSIWLEPGFEAVATDEIDKKAFSLAAKILDGIEQKFGISFPFNHLIESIPKEDWERFIRVFSHDKIVL